MANTYTYSRDAHSYTNSYRHSHRYGHGHGHCHRHRHCYGYCYCYCHSYRYRHTRTYRHSHCHSYRFCYCYCPGATLPPQPLLRPRRHPRQPHPRARRRPRSLSISRPVCPSRPVIMPGSAGSSLREPFPKHVLIRAIGPSLAQFGVPNFLADPTLELNGPGSLLPSRTTTGEKTPCRKP